MDYKGDINNQGKKEDRIIISKDGDYLYPNSKAIYTVMEFGSMHPQLQRGMIISTATGTTEYDSGTHCFIGCGIPQGNFEYPYIYRVRVHPIGYNYDGYDEKVPIAYGFDYYEIDEIIEKVENQNCKSKNSD